MFDEDPRENLRICLEWAPQYCVACSDFHISFAVRRWSGRSMGMTRDGENVTALVAQALRRRLESETAPSVLIAGAADTGLLHAVLEAAVREGGEGLARSLDITIVDLCETPLEMCRRYAERLGLTIRTTRSDLGSFVPSKPFGIILMHGVLAFFPADRRREYMQRISGWLDEDGYVVSATQVGEHRETPEEVAAVVDVQTAAFQRFVDEGHPREPVDVAYFRDSIGKAVRIRRSYEALFSDLDELAAFYEGAGVHLLDRAVVEINSEEKRRYKQRAVVLGQVSGA